MWLVQTILIKCLDSEYTLKCNNIHTSNSLVAILSDLESFQSGYWYLRSNIWRIHFQTLNVHLYPLYMFILYICFYILFCFIVNKVHSCNSKKKIWWSIPNHYGISVSQMTAIPSFFPRSWLITGFLKWVFGGV